MRKILKRGDLLLLYEVIKPYRKFIGIAVNRNWVVLIRDNDISFCQFRGLQFKYNITVKRLYDKLLALRIFNKLLDNLFILTIINTFWWFYGVTSGYIVSPWRIYIPQILLKIIAVIFRTDFRKSVKYKKTFKIPGEVFVAKQIYRYSRLQIKEGKSLGNITIEDYLSNNVIFKEIKEL